jgi:hypothetical protein
MAARGVLSLTAEAPPVPLRGANPTSWTTVFWYIVLVSMMTFSVIWMEFSGPSAQRRRLSDRADAKFSLVDFFRNKLRLLWATVLILTLVMLGQAGVFYAKNYEAETARLTQSARVTNEAFVQHTLQVISQVDTLLQSVRGFYLRTGSVVETENFINALPFDKSTIDNIYLISPQAQLLIRPGSPTPGPNFADRDYYQLHRSNANDDIWISSVEVGLVTGKYHFRITRRISNPDGSFGGIVLATVILNRLPATTANWLQGRKTSQLWWAPLTESSGLVRQNHPMTVGKLRLIHRCGRHWHKPRPAPIQL